MAAAYAALVSLSLILDQLRNPPPTHQFSVPIQQVESMQKEVGILISFLEKYPTTRIHEIQDLEKRIVDAAHEAEDIIESYVVRQIKAKYQLHQNSARFLRSMQNEILNFISIRAIVEVIRKFISIRKKVDKIRCRAGVGYESTTTAGSSSRSLPGGKNIMIGFDEHLNQVRDILASLQKLECLVLAFRGNWENMAFPNSLKKLSLSDCEIPWKDMSMVGSLPNLEVLKLQNRAAKGRTWNPNANEFCRLKFLLMDQCEMENWVADDGHFPCLEHLHLVIMKMEEIPLEFAEIPTLQTIDLNYCSRSLFASAKRISKERDALGYDEIQVRSFPSEATRLRKENVVGLQYDVEKIIGYLTNETGELDVVSIIGEAGIGKTTLADKIFHDPDIQKKFPIRIWVNVSQEFTLKYILYTILKKLSTNAADFESPLSVWPGLVAEYLERKKFLLVMDDVWSCGDWKKTQTALPKSNYMGKVLITSRNDEVGKYANPHRRPHMLHFLTPEEKRRLLQLEVFGKPEYPRELEAEGRLIAQRCKGLPFAIVLIGGFLINSFSASSEMGAIKEAWQEVSHILYLYDSHMRQIISLSYRKLPYHLRKCFLYMGMFAQGLEIPTW